MCTASPPDSPDLPQRQVTACGRAGRRWRSWAWRERPCQTQHGGWCRRRCREAAACSFESAASRARGEGGAGGSGVWRAAVVLPLQAPPACPGRRAAWTVADTGGAGPRQWRRSCRRTTIEVFGTRGPAATWAKTASTWLACRVHTSAGGDLRRRRLAPDRARRLLHGSRRFLRKRVKRKNY